MNPSLSLPEDFASSFSIVSVIHEPSSDTLSVYVQALNPMSAHERGKTLLDLEDVLCKDNPSVRLWHTPLGDRNTLRNLRGISISN